jgi:hypothetical protein
LTEQEVFPVKNHGLALVASAALMAGAAGCGMAVPGPARPSPPGRTSPPAVLSVACTPGRLGAALEGSSEPGTGGAALAIVYLWNKSATACRLAGPVTITGLSLAGRTVTTSVLFRLPAGSAPLSPDGIRPGTLGRMPAREVVASMLLIAAGAHPSDPALACPGLHVDPAIWRITLASGGSLTTPNASAASGPALTRDGGLTTCRGNLYRQSPMSIGP